MKTDKDYFNGVILVGITDALNILGVSKRYLHLLAKEKRIQSQKTSSGYIFPLDAVKDFQAKRIQKAKSDPRIRINS